MENIVLIAGVHGVSGRAAAIRWAGVPGTKVYGLSRRDAELPEGVEGIAVDLLDRADVERKLGGLAGITHVVFAAYIEKASSWENGYVESVNSKLRDELLNGEVFNTLREAQVLIEEWRQHYNRVRPHSSLGYRPPAPEAVVMVRPGSGSGAVVAVVH